jgi:hypothetical protein
LLSTSIMWKQIEHSTNFCVLFPLTTWQTCWKFASFLTTTYQMFIFGMEKILGHVVLTNFIYFWDYNKGLPLTTMLSKTIQLSVNNFSLPSILVQTLHLTWLDAPSHEHPPPSQHMKALHFTHHETPSILQVTMFQAFQLDFWPKDWSI